MGDNGKNGNGQHHDNGNGNGKVNFEDMTVEGVKLLFPGMGAGPLISANLDSGNAGIRLVQNDSNLLDMLKIVYVEDYEKADNVSDALGECDEFLLDDDGKTENKEVKQRVEWIKYKLAIYCSVKGRFADAYKQAATGVLTNAMSERGWNLLNIPLGRNGPEQHPQNDGQNKKRP